MIRSLRNTGARFFKSAVAAWSSSPREKLENAWENVNTNYSELMAHTQGERMERDVTILANEGYDLVEALNSFVEVVIDVDMAEEAKRREAAALSADAAAAAAASALFGAGGGGGGGGRGRNLEEHKFRQDDLRGAEGTCMDLFIEREFIKQLCSLGMPDRPIGMRGLITQALNAILKHVSYPILPNMSVHTAIREFISLSFQKGDSSHKRHKKALFELMRVLCAKIRGEPSLARVFFEDSVPQGAVRAHTNAGGAPNAALSPAPPASAQKFLIFSVLQRSINIKGVHSKEAIKGLMDCLHVPDEDIAKWIAIESDFPYRMIAGLALRFRKTPKKFWVFGKDQANSSLSEEAGAVSQGLLGMDANQSSAKQRSSRAFTAFFERLKLIDQAFSCSFPVIGEVLGREFEYTFLRALIHPMLTAVAENEARWAIVFMTLVLRSVSSPELQGTIVNFLVQSKKTDDLLSDDDETQEDKQDEAVDDCSVRSSLLDRLQSFDDALALDSMRLFRSIMDTQRQDVYETLLELPAPLKVGSALELQASPTPEDEQIAREVLSDVLSGFKEAVELEDYVEDAHHMSAAWSSSSWFQQLQFERDELEELKLKHQVAVGRAERDGTEIPEAPIVEDSRPPETLQSESKFLSLLLHRMGQSADRSMEHNVMLTGLLAQIAVCPDPRVHRLCFPSTSSAGESPEEGKEEAGSPSRVAPGQKRTIVSALAIAHQRIFTRTSRLNNFDARLAAVRRRLIGERNAVHPSPGGIDANAAESPDAVRPFAAIIVLQEFAKEMLAIAKVKNGMQNARRDAYSAGRFDGFSARSSSLAGDFDQAAMDAAVAQAAKDGSKAVSGQKKKSFLRKNKKKKKNANSPSVALPVAKPASSQ